MVVSDYAAFYRDIDFREHPEKYFIGRGEQGATGKKYSALGNILPQDSASEQSAKAKSARIFKHYYDQARTDATYLAQKAKHLALQHPDKA